MKMPTPAAISPYVRAFLPSVAETTVLSTSSSEALNVPDIIIVAYSFALS